MRQNIRRTLVYISLFLFPVTLNYLSPYVSIDGALSGLVSGSVIVFLAQFISGIFFGRAWCGWVCPAAGISELGLTINSRPVPVRKLAVIRYSIYALWFSFLVTCFILAGGIRGIDPLHLTENIISVDEPAKYISYYMVLFLFFALTVLIGKRGACHSICWMSPFMTGGYLLGKKLHIPQLRMKADASLCIACRKCSNRCPMSIDVCNMLKSGAINSSDCILCGECADCCPKKVLYYGIRR